MKKHVKITNKGTVNRLLLEIIGLGTKQGRHDDVLIVGQYHSGFKLATPAAIRMGMEVVAASSDVIGPYVLNFATKKISLVQDGETIGAELLCYNYSDGREVCLSIALTAFPQWERAIGDDGNRVYPILREYIANARDEDRNYALEFGATDIAEPPAGYTAVYLEETEDTDTVLKKYPDRYFKFMGAVPLFAVPDAGAIYPKSSKDIRFFNQGYLVGCKEGEYLSEALYDYDVCGKDIVNEIRTIRDQDVYDRRVAELFTRIRNKLLLRKIIDFVHGNLLSYEAGIFKWIKRSEAPEEFKALCREIWKDKFGEMSVISCGKGSIDSEAKDILGLNVVAVPYDLREFFKSIGIKDSEQRMKEFLADLGERPLNEDERKLIEGIKEKYFNELDYYRRVAAQYSVAVLIDKFQFLSGRAPGCKRVLMSEKYLNEADEHALLETYLHELRHCITGLHDTSRDFGKTADFEIVYLLEYARCCRHKIKILEHELRKRGVNVEELFSEK